jgi:hypothetical protein
VAPLVQIDLTSFSSPWPQALTTTANLLALATMMAAPPSLLLAVNSAPLTAKPSRPVRGEGVELAPFGALYLPRTAVPGVEGERGESSRAVEGVGGCASHQ